MKYRTDRYETNEHGQHIGYVDWIGGPTISKVQAACPDGLTRWAHITGEPDTWFSIPAYVNNGSRGRITGWVGTDDGLWQFHPHTDQLPIDWRPTKTVRSIVPLNS
jgi:hypothetical protein